MIARRFTLTALVSLCAVVGLFAFASVSAQALVTHYYSPTASAKINEGIPTEGPHGEKILRPGPLELGDLSMTVDSGHLWAVEGAVRVDEFDAATGAFLSQPITRPEEVFFEADGGTAGVAVGHATGKAEVYVGEGTSKGTAIGVYSESGTLDGTWTGAETPAGSFSPGLDVAVDNSTDPLDEHKGDVFVSSERQGVVNIFHPEADGKEHYVGQITGFSPTEPFKEIRRMTVDGSNGDVVVITENGVDIFESAALGEYVLVHKITGPPAGPFGEAFNLSADDVSGDIYVDDLSFEKGADGVIIDQFSSAGVYLGRITGVETPQGKIKDVYAVAVDPESHNVYVGDVNSKEMDVFGPNIVFPDVATEPASSVAPFSATLNGTVNPDKAGAATCRFEWGTGKAFGKTAPCEPEGVAEGGSPVPVHAALSGLQTDTTYYYRLQATNTNGTNPGEASQDQEFTTLGPGIEDESVTDVASTSVTFRARINPHKVPSSVYFQYGTSVAYGIDLPAPPGEALGSGEGDVEVTPHHVQGLLAGTVYHYRVVVVTEPKLGETVVFDGPDQVFTTQTAAVSGLPDGRHWEMVTPPDKRGAIIQPVGIGMMRAADNGNAISYVADNPTEAEPPGFREEMQILSSRGPEDWNTRNIALPHRGLAGTSVGEGLEYRFFSSDLSRAVVQPFGSLDPELSTEASASTAMLRSLDASCSSSCYRPLVTGKPGFANVPPGTVFGSEVNGKCPVLICGPFFFGGTPDLQHILLSVTGIGDVEWSGGKLTSPIDVLPNGSPMEDPAFGGDGSNPRGAISRDGSRVILMTAAGGGIYMRDIALEKTVKLNVAESACVAEHKCESDGGMFQLANADGSKVFFTNSSETHRLVKGAGLVGSDLYECEMVETAGKLECRLADIAKEAMGVLGASEDGSYLYFVANSVLAEGAVPGECEEGGTPRPGATCNLYVRHGGVTRLVALLSVEDRHDWTRILSGSPTRVSPDGNWLEFMSQRPLTGYDNRDAVSGKPDAEVYLYSASAGRLVCASCDPSGARPLGAEYGNLSAFGSLIGDIGVWEETGWVAASVPGWINFNLSATSNDQPRYLSNSGRLFFNSSDAIVPQDVNGTEDVYEYEPPGVGACTSSSPTFSKSSGGCAGLISGGASAEESGFLDASENGGDVFFLTYSKLQPQDYDSAIDIYDAHECTSASPCFPARVPQPPACTTAEACRVAPTPQPASFGAPSSATFSGAGNIAPGSGGVVAVKPLTRAQQLASALKACKRKAKKRRAGCERHARARFGAVKSDKAAAKKGKR